MNRYGKNVGSRHHRAKLTNREIELIRQLYAQGMSYRELAGKFEVNYWHIGRVCRHQRRYYS